MPKKSSRGGAGPIIIKPGKSSGAKAKKKAKK